MALTGNGSGLKIAVLGTSALLLAVSAASAAYLLSRVDWLAIGSGLSASRQVKRQEQQAPLPKIPREAEVGRRGTASSEPAGPRDPASWIVADDYPAQALREELEGHVAVRLSVGMDGRAYACDVEDSSGHPVLDTATCGVLAKRARFAVLPAGRATVTRYHRQKVTWRLP